MEINKQIKQKVDQCTWRMVPYRNGGSPHATYDEIVNDSFEAVKRVGRCASHCRLYEMYHPTLGNLRMSRSYSALAPSNGMKPSGAVRFVEPDLRPYAAYKPKQGEWMMIKERQSSHPPHSQHACHVAEPLAIPIAPTMRRQYPVPADATRFENFSRYWNGRAKGLAFSDPFLYQRRDNYDIMESRRYQRLYWAPHFIPSQPTARHARQIMLTAY